MKTKYLKLLALMPFIASAGVNLKNGNHYISYTDIAVPGGGHDLEITRVNNSKSVDVGWFGVGWASDFETFLLVEADGAVTIHEHGAGANTRFTPKESVNPEEGAKKIIEAMKKAGSSEMTGASGQSMLKRLVEDAELRSQYAIKYAVKTSLSNGTKLYSNMRGPQTLEKTAEGYKRTFVEGKVEYFTDKGLLSKITDKNGYSIELTYNKDNRVVSIKDSQAKQVFLDWYPSGFVKSMWSVGDKKSTYQYDGKKLKEAIDVENNKYVYGYDGNYNLTEVSYVDGSKYRVKYDPKTQSATEVAEKNGTVTKYEYGGDSKNPDLHYWTTVTKVIKGITPVANKYEYELKKKPDGSIYTYRIYTEVDGLKTDTIYSECCGLPLKIAQGKNITNFEYNKDGLLVKKSSTAGDYIELAYDEKLKKVSKFTNEKGWTSFDYDERGNLQKATNSAGVTVLLVHNRNGLITKMVDFDKNTNIKRTLSFQYNALGKPVEVAMEKVGKINIAYDNYGEIKNVESSQGPQMALQVTQAFQALTAIIKPANVSLDL